MVSQEMPTWAHDGSYLHVSSKNRYQVGCHNEGPSVLWFCEIKTFHHQIEKLPPV